MKYWMLCNALSLSLGLSFTALANHSDSHKSDADSGCADKNNPDFSISSYDTNKDGVVTKQEYLNANKRNTEKLFAHLDANQDGKLDQTEQAEIEAVYKLIHEDMCTKQIII